jgi:hypothetical protein
MHLVVAEERGDREDRLMPPHVATLNEPSKKGLRLAVLTE